MIMKTEKNGKDYSSQTGGQLEGKQYRDFLYIDDLLIAINKCFKINEKDQKSKLKSLASDKISLHNIRTVQ